ncbi:uncharacterized protein LOC142340500 [Convolutriloba macropyga]|uniref:uncharacterized protein LOC142340500 n=1 Tax=Convolutriloba macropyga TaxID=536237 RepID=UPI003F52630C
MVLTLDRLIVTVKRYRTSNAAKRIEEAKQKRKRKKQMAKSDTVLVNGASCCLMGDISTDDNISSEISSPEYSPVMNFIESRRNSSRGNRMSNKNSSHRNHVNNINNNNNNNDDNSDIKNRKRSAVKSPSMITDSAKLSSNNIQMTTMV